VKGAEPWHSFERTSRKRSDPFAHFARRLVGKGDCEDLAGPRLPARDEVRKPRSKGSRLSGSGARKNKYGTFRR
jgi:hypothetical protein